MPASRALSLLPGCPQALEASVQHLADDWIDVAVLLLLQLLNVFLGFFEELKARARCDPSPARCCDVTGG